MEIDLHQSNVQKISKKQRRFLASDARLVVFRAGIRAGKTWVLCLKALEYALNKRRFCIVSFSYPVLRDVCIYTMRQILLSYNYPFTENISDKYITVDGENILFRSGDAPDSLRGLSLDGFGIDEGREFKNRDVYDVMIGRLSNSKNAQGYITTSPKGKNWVNKLEGQPGVETIIQRTEENPFLPPEYIINLRSQYTSDFARQELDADIVEFGAGVISSTWFNMVQAYKPAKGVRFWDLAVSIKTSADFSAGALCSFGQKFTVHDIRHGKMTYPDLRQHIIDCAKQDGPDIDIVVEQAGQQVGYINDLQQIPELRGYTVRGQKPTGDKLTRAIRWATRAEAGMVDVCRGDWNQPFFDECNSFSGDDSHEHDDFVDSISGAYQYLSDSAGRVWSKASTTGLLPITLDWSRVLPTNHQYIGMWYNDVGELYVIATVWDSIEGKLYVYWANKFTSIVPDLLVAKLIVDCKCKIIITTILGNDNLIGDGRTPGRLLTFALKRQQVHAGLRVPVNYDQLGAIAYTGSLFTTNSIYISSTIQEVAGQCAGWTYKDKGKPPPEFGYEYCMALCLIMSEVKRLIIHPKDRVKPQDYSKRLDVVTPEQRVNSWQVA
jgi:predicted phage terminase large subunit-like protein